MLLKIIQRFLKLNQENDIILQSSLTFVTIPDKLNEILHFTSTFHMLNKVSKVTNERFIISLFLFSHVMSKVLQTLPDVPIIVKLISSGLLIFPLVQWRGTSFEHTWISFIKGCFLLTWLELSRTSGSGDEDENAKHLQQRWWQQRRRRRQGTNFY